MAVILKYGSDKKLNKVANRSRIRVKCPNCGCIELLDNDDIKNRKFHDWVSACGDGVYLEEEINYICDYCGNSVRYIKNANGPIANIHYRLWDFLDKHDLDILVKAILWTFGGIFALAFLLCFIIYFICGGSLDHRYKIAGVKDGKIETFYTDSINHDDNCISFTYDGSDFVFKNGEYLIEDRNSEEGDSNE